MKDWIPIGVIGMTLPGAGVGVEMVRTGLGSVGEPQPVMNSVAATRAIEAIRKITAIRFDYHTAVKSAP